ncbi:MAG: thiolase family protein [Chloroflexi bacterium]|nr:thiolase family protein [Chloroflexota bacterium]
MRNRAAIVGVGLTKTALTTKIKGLPGWTADDLYVEGFQNAINDAGLKKEQIDGLMTQGAANHYIVLGQQLGINPAYGGTMNGGGATAGMLIGAAAMAVNHGLANYVAITFASGWERPAPGAVPPEAGGPDPIPYANWGALGPIIQSATSASRHMAVYGTKSEQLAEIAVAFRQHASLNPDAIMQKPITIEDHQNSRWIVEPLKLLDCCLVTSGGVCLIVTTKERARDLRQPVVSILGFGQGFTTQNLERQTWWAGPHQRDAIQRAYTMAGVGPKDIQVAQIYDNFTCNVIMQIEHAGFCGVGEGGSFVEGGRIQLGGPLPLNTDGGQLSHTHPEGFMQVAEGVLQMRHACGPRNVPNAHLELVTGRGMALNAASALVLTDQV